MTNIEMKYCWLQRMGNDKKLEVLQVKGQLYAGDLSTKHLGGRRLRLVSDLLEIQFGSHRISHLTQTPGKNRASSGSNHCDWRKYTTRSTRDPPPHTSRLYDGWTTTSMAVTMGIDVLLPRLVACRIHLMTNGNCLQRHGAWNRMI